MTLSADMKECMFILGVEETDFDILYYGDPATGAIRESMDEIICFLGSGVGGCDVADSLTSVSRRCASSRASSAC